MKSQPFWCPKNEKNVIAVLFLYIFCVLCTTTIFVLTELKCANQPEDEGYGASDWEEMCGCNQACE